MLMSTTLLFEAHGTISSRGRSRHTISCANGPKTFARGYENSHLTTPNVWMTTSLLVWFRSSTLPHTAKSAEPTSRSTMSLEQGGEIWRAQKGHGSDSRVVGAPKIKAQDIGVTRWTTNLDIGTGVNLFALVCVPIFHYWRENTE